jgi:hypothetical protein
MREQLCDKDRDRLMALQVHEEGRGGHTPAEGERIHTQVPGERLYADPPRTR